MKRIIFLILTIFVIISFSQVFAANLADVSRDERLCRDIFVKPIYDDGPRALFINLPTGENSAVSVFNWQTGNSKSRSTSFKLIAELSSLFEGAVGTDLIQEDGIASFAHYGGMDIHTRDRRIGVGAVIPLQRRESLKVGPWFRIKDFFVYTSFIEGSDNERFGVSYIKSFTLDIAFQDIKGKDDVYYIRMSKCFSFDFGMLIPEIRTKFTPEKDFFGFGIGFIPKK